MVIVFFFIVLVPFFHLPWICQSSQALTSFSGPLVYESSSRTQTSLLTNTQTAEASSEDDSDIGRATGGLLSATLTHIAKTARQEYETVTKHRLHIWKDYGRVLQGITELRNLTEELRKSLQTISPSPKEKSNSPILSPANDAWLMSSPLHSEVAEVVDEQFSLLKNSAELGLLDARSIRRIVLPLLEQAPSAGELVKFSVSLKEQFLTREKLFQDMRSLGDLLQLKSAIMYPHPEKPHSNTFHVSKMEALVADHVSLLSRSKASEVNYASERCGATVMRTSNDEMEGSHSSALLSDDTRPGHAWNVLSLPASIVFKLCLPIRISAVSVEHITGFFPELHLTNSAPADFEVHGYGRLEEKHPAFISKFKFDQGGESLQKFNVERVDIELSFLALALLSNHGNPCKTSMYHIKVHGEPSTINLDIYKFGI